MTDTTTMIPLDDYLEACAAAIEEAARTSIAGVLAAGKALDAARKQFPSDNAFGQWRERRMPWLSREMAWHWRNVYRKFGDDELVLNRLTPGRALYALAAPSTPSEVVEAAQVMSEQGDKVNLDVVNQLKQEVEALRQNRDETIARIRREQHEKLMAKEQEAERLRKTNRGLRAATRASDREASLSESLAKAEAQAADLRSKLASAEAQMQGGLGISEMLEPKVVIQKDPQAEREIESLKKRLAEETRLKETYARNADSMHEASLNAQARMNELKQAKDSLDNIKINLLDRLREARSLSGYLVKYADDEKIVRLGPAELAQVRETIERLNRLIESGCDASALIATPA